MTTVKVESLIKEKEKSDKIESIKEKKEDEKLKKELAPRKFKVQMRQRGGVQSMAPRIPAQLMQQLTAIREQPDETEIKSGLKEAVFQVASLPIRKEKRQDLYGRISKSEYLNKYIDNNIYLDYLKGLDSNLKAGACYLFHYASCLRN